MTKTFIVFLYYKLKLKTLNLFGAKLIYLSYRHLRWSCVWILLLPTDWKDKISWIWAWDFTLDYGVFFFLIFLLLPLNKSLNPIEEDRVRSANFPCNRSLTTHICSFSFLKKKKTFVFSTFFKAMIPGNGIYVASLRQNNQLVIFDEFLSCPIKKKKVREYVHIKGTEIVCVYIYIY